ncbi:MAG TPA: DMT family transporter [Terriglobales bacterium]|nr:DMT family transporter [Terriglobales bacterium]
MRSWIYLLACNFMWALQFTCVKLVQEQVGPLFTVWGPMTLATVMLWPLIRSEQRHDTASAHKSKSDVLRYLLMAAVGVFPAQVWVTWGTRMSTASNAAVIALTAPITMAILAVIILHERMTRNRWISFGLAVVGVLLCSTTDLRQAHFASHYWVGNMLVFLGLTGSGFYNTYGKKMLERYSPMEMLFYTYAAMFLIMTPVVIMSERDVFARIPQFTVQTWIGLALLTFFHNFLSMVLFLKALKVLDAIQASVSNYLVSFFGVPIAAIWLGERLTVPAIVGGLLVLGSTILMTFWDRGGAPAVSAAAASGEAHASATADSR